MSLHRIDAFLLSDLFLSFGMEFDLADADAFFSSCDFCAVFSIGLSLAWKNSPFFGELGLPFILLILSAQLAASLGDKYNHHHMTNTRRSGRTD